MVRGRRKNVKLVNSKKFNNHNHEESIVIEISTVSSEPQMMRDFVFKARVIDKTPIRSFNNQKYFTIDVIDKKLIKRRCIIYEAHVNLFYNIFQIGKSYKFSQVKFSANLKSNYFNSLDEVILDDLSIVIECEETDDTIRF